VAGTPVATCDGPVPIETIQKGDGILTRSQDHPEEPAKRGRVTRVFRNLAPVVLWLTLSTGEVMGTTPGHEVWTFEDGWTFAGELQVGEAFMDADGEPVTVLSIELDPTPTLVYNFEVDGTFTYFAHDVWVHNNSCRQMLFHAHHALAKFLGGADNGIKVLLDEKLHNIYHSGLQRRLADAGVWPSKGDKWIDYFRTNPGAQERALNIMMDYTRDFDSAHGTSLLRYAWDQIRSQWW